jgi:N-acetylglucosaminyldiphosphoundecaprenol N-acetyl-beta-D-mannosaminyltransferase
MGNYFNVNLEFNKAKIDEAIQQTIERDVSAYVCSVDGNSLITANKNPAHLEALNGALINLCDSAWTPIFINLIHGTKYKNYTGADLFLEYIKSKRYRQFFLGSTEKILSGLKVELSKIDPAIAEMQFSTLPFRKIEEFDYPQIAQMINEDNPDIIWVSLGAPKQEQFMARLKPFLNRGVMFGFGAIFNFNSGYPNQRRAPRWIIRLKMEWLFRTYQEPPRMVKRYWNVFLSFPRLIVQEMKK